MDRKIPAAAASISCALLLFGLHPVSRAAEPVSRFAVTAGVATTDNILLDFNNEQSETVSSAGIEFDVNKASRRYVAEFNGDLAYMNYSSGDFDSEVVGSAAGLVRLSLVDDLLSWTLMDRFGQTRPDLLEAASPENRDSYNFLSTGPNVTLRLGQNVDVVLAGRYSRIDYDDSRELDTQRFIQSLSIERTLSSNAVLSLTATAQKVDPDEAPIYDQREAVVSYAISGARSRLMLQAGASQIETVQDNDSSLVLRLDFTRNLGQRSEVALRIGREMIDAAGSLGGWSGDGLPPATSLTGDLSRTIDPLRVDMVELNWRARGRLTDVRAGGRWAMETSTAAPDTKRRRREVNAGVSRQLTPMFDAAVDVRHSSQDFRAMGGTRETGGVLGLGAQVGRRLSIVGQAELTYFRLKGTSNEARERRFWLRLRYGN
jgi:hypothetical protein